MSEISIPFSIYKKIANYINNFPVQDNQKITIREIATSGIGISYEVKISGTNEDDDRGIFEAGIYANFAEFDKW
jgi:hypothetical protein